MLIMPLDVLRGNAKLLDPAVLDTVLESCSSRIKNWLGVDISCLGILLLYPEKELLKLPNFGRKSLIELRAAVESHGYKMEQGITLFSAYQTFLKDSGISETMPSAVRLADQTHEAIRTHVAKLYGIDTKTSPSEEISLDISLPYWTLETVGETPLSNTLTGLCQKAFEAAVLSRLNPSENTPSITSDEGYHPTEGYQISIRVPITLCDSWKSAFKQPFLNQVAQELSVDATLRFQALEEITKKIAAAFAP